jgi:hypothetical protein
MDECGRLISLTATAQLFTYFELCTFHFQL